VKTVLKWNAGKFVHLRGVETPLHFMPLHHFHLEYGLDLSVLMALRATRLQQGSSSISEIPLSQWLSRSAATEIAALAFRALDQAESPRTVMEVYPGVGLVFESLKNMLHRLPGDSQNGAFKYLAAGPESGDFTFSQLHSEDVIPFEYVDWRRENVSSFARESSVMIVNHWQSTRGDEPIEDVCGWLRMRTGPVVVAARAAKESQGIFRTTVRRTNVYVPEVAEIMEALSDSGRSCQYRFFTDFDSAYLLPKSGASDGLLLAVGTGNPMSINGFTPW
jgi:hypothetical protein